MEAETMYSVPGLERGSKLQILKESIQRSK
jgi:hypothetical protein